MKSVESEHKSRHRSLNVLEARLGKILKLYYKIFPRDFEIIIIKWGDGVQDLKLRATLRN